jgi:hypothetical protein
MKRRTLLSTLLLILLLCIEFDKPANRLSRLDVLKQDHPRVVYFRQTENTLNYDSYESWEDDFDNAMGIIGQALPWQLALQWKWELKKNPVFFTRFKQDNPNQVALLHRDANEQDPRGFAWFSEEDFYPGHWLYYEGTMILSDVPFEDGLTDMKVADASRFHVNIGFNGDDDDEIGLFMLDDSGKPDWNRCEQVRLTAVDTQQNVITVIRGQYGTEPRIFPAGKAWAAPHAVNGPWRDDTHLTWQFNYSTLCPRDERGRTCADVLAGYLARDLGPGGPLYNIDGFAEDFIYNAPRCNWRVARGRLPDFNGDGMGDDFLSDKTHASGVIEFYRKLRKLVGEDLLITSDAQCIDNQRAFGILNGTEMEQWPTHGPTLYKWSTGMNRNAFWDLNGRKPVFNYIKAYPRESYSELRLKFAGAVFTNAAIATSQSTREIAESGIWDEMRMGQENRLAWMGKALAPAVHIARGREDMLMGLGSPPEPELLKRLSGADAEITLENESMKVRSTGSVIRFQLKDVPCNGPDLTVFVTAHGEPIEGFPEEYARLMVVTDSTKDLSFPTNQIHAFEENRRLNTFINQDNFTSVFYFSGVQGGKVDLEFSIEGKEPVWITGITAYSHPDALYREFENGVVLGNPSPAPYTFDLEALFPGHEFRRLRGNEKQDPVTNDGSEVKGPVTLKGWDGLFLIKK